MILVYFASDGCVDNVVNNRVYFSHNRTFHEECKNVLDYQKNCFQCVRLFKPQLEMYTQPI